jgi:hypothetical protein
MQKALRDACDGRYRVYAYNMRQYNTIYYTSFVRTHYTQCTRTLISRTYMIFVCQNYIGTNTGDTRLPGIRCRDGWE